MSPKERLARRAVAHCMKLHGNDYGEISLDTINDTVRFLTTHCTILHLYWLIHSRPSPKGQCRPWHVPIQYQHDDTPSIDYQGFDKPSTY